VPFFKFPFWHIPLEALDFLGFRVLFRVSIFLLFQLIMAEVLIHNIFDDSP
jgi:hypothetical protein